MVAHGKLSFHVCLNSAGDARNYKSVQSLRRFVQPVRSNPSACFALGASRMVRAYLSLFEVNETRMSRLRNFDTEPPPPYCYGFRSDNRLESVANAHTAADLHVRPVS